MRLSHKENGGVLPQESLQATEVIFLSSPFIDGFPLYCIALYVMYLICETVFSAAKLRTLLRALGLSFFSKF